ncbi:MAG: hypothetical protein UT22_C0019G0010 [Parcubacteria group bacterium GW2011_GWC2_39_11]|nr:MAG: hypothetical protein US88_C0013G0010 [Parcubacteria group bacterium GW2011_GWA2_38_27]KKQ96992.1 MAG: hypothetical protein UT22_C0019G0010 [Parcubacteria group bacterium GW2011_GWC2_39_11]
MINLLPPKEKNKILTEIKIKVAAIHWFLVLFFISCLLAFFVFINLYIKIQLDAQRAKADQIMGFSFKAEELDLEKRIALLDFDVAEINKFYENKVYFSEIFDKISAVMPGNIYFTNLTVDKKKEEIVVSVSGFSPSREGLLELKKNIDKEGDYFQNVYFPQSDWVKPSDINFFISFGLKEKNKE